MPSSRALVGGCCAALLAACATVDDGRDVALITAATLSTGDGAGLVTAFADSIALASGGMPTGMSSFEDVMVIGRHGSGRYSYMISCRDAGGAPSRCGEQTSSATLFAAFDIDLARPDLPGKVSHSATWELDGMSSKAATLTGTSSLEVTFTIGDTTYELAGRPVTSVDLGSEAWMMSLGGSVAWTFAGTRDHDELTLPITVDLDDGWASAAVAIDTRTYRVDLVSGEIRDDAR